MGKKAVFVRVSARMQQSKRKHEVVISLEENIRGNNGSVVMFGKDREIYHAPYMGH